MNSLLATSKLRNMWILLVLVLLGLLLASAPCWANTWSGFTVPPTTIPVGQGTLAPYAITAADFNGDGNLDLAVVDTPQSGTGAVSILLGNGDGTFQAQKMYAVGNVPKSIAVGDFNGDGKLDLAVTNSGDGTVSILL